MNLDRVTIQATGAELAGLLYQPDGTAKPAVIVLTHGFTSSKASMDLLAAYLCRRGYACLAYDCRGHKLGASTGRLDHIEQAVDDLSQVIAYTRQRLAAGRIVLAGHSMGALLSFAAAESDPAVEAVIAIATGPKPSHGFGSRVGAAMLEQRSAYVEGAAVMDLLREMDGLAASIDRNGSRPSLFVAARGDVLVKPSTLQELARRAGPLAEFAEVDGAHLDAPNRAVGVVGNWLERVTG